MMMIEGILAKNLIAQIIIENVIEFIINRPIDTLTGRFTK